MILVLNIFNNNDIFCQTAIYFIILFVVYFVMFKWKQYLSKWTIKNEINNNLKQMAQDTCGHRDHLR